MKRIIVAILAALVLATGSGAALAEEEHAGLGEQGTEIEAGLKTWWNTWKRSGPESFTSDSVFMLGPVVEAKFHNNIFVEASYLVTTSDYKLFTDPDGIAVTSDRKDLDLAVGYMFRREFGVFAGYRNADFKENVGTKETVYGPLVGVRADVPVAEAFSIYGTVTYLINRFRAEDELGNAARERCPGWIAEAGVKYEVMKHLALSAGYKYETTKTSDTDVKDKFYGLTLGAMYAFE